MAEAAPRRRWQRTALRVAAVVGGLVLALAIPDCPPQVPQGPGAEPFVWDQDALWKRLEARYDAIVATGCTDGPGPSLTRLDAQLDTLATIEPGPSDPRWDAIEQQVFEAATIVAACGEGLPRLLDARTRLRSRAKAISQTWPVDTASRERLYRLLYGARAAIEEVLLQSPAQAPSLALEFAIDEPSQAPSTEIEGVRIHSGDLLLSRGGAPTSAMIARGSDHPGNFSHVALVHVDESGKALAIEAHIERGVAIADAEAYFADKKLRIAVLRLRADHPAVVEQPLLAHHAATKALEQARARHIPYDFTMNVADDTERFCSEVASAAYRTQGIELWQHLSTFSSPGLARWMAGFGVEHLETHGPSDLEYDPQLVVVAEYHDPQTLLDDHIDSAVIDAMLEQAERGAELEHNPWMLPVARVLKAYSVVLNVFGAEGPIPEGMSATTGLRVQWLMERHGAIEADVRTRMEAYEQTHGRLPPYWSLVAMARAAAER